MTTLVGPGQSVTSVANATSDSTYLVLAGALDVPEGLTSSGGGTMKVTIFSARWVWQELTAAQSSARQWVRLIDTGVGGATPWQAQSVVTGVGNSTLITMGDSLTGLGAYQPQLSNRLGSANIVNCGIGGTMLSYQTAQTDWCELSFARLVDAIVDNSWSAVDTAVTHLLAAGYDYRAIITQLKATNFSALQYLTALYGTNDFTGSAPFGTSGEDNKTTFYGAIQYATRRLMTAFPSLKLAFITTTYRSATTGAAGSFDPDTMTINGHYLHEFADAVIDRCHALSVPVLDLYRTSGINKYNWSTKLSDGVHLNPATGGIDVGNHIGGFLAGTL